MVGGKGDMESDSARLHVEKMGRNRCHIARAGSAVSVRSTGMSTFRMQRDLNDANAPHEHRRYVSYDAFIAFAHGALVM